MAILIVEDNATNGMIIRHLAKKVHEGEIIVETDAKEALARCRAADFDLLIVDQVMPGMTGVQFTRALRAMERYRLTPVVMVTADHSPDLRQEAEAAGVSDFLTKPVEALAFRKLIASLAIARPAVA